MWLYLGFVHIRKLDSHFVSTILVPHSVFSLVCKGGKNVVFEFFIASCIYLCACGRTYSNKFHSMQVEVGDDFQTSVLLSHHVGPGTLTQVIRQQVLLPAEPPWQPSRAISYHLFTSDFFPFNKLFEVDVSEEFWDCLSSLFETESYVTQADLEVKLSLSPHVIKCRGYRFTSMLDRVYDLSSHLGLPLLSSSSCSFPVVCQRQFVV